MGQCIPAGPVQKYDVMLNSTDKKTGQVCPMNQNTGAGNVID